MPYAILRFQKRKAGGVAACERHNERKKEAYKSKIGMERLKKYFPKGTTPKQMEDTIIKLLERELQRKRGRDSR